MAEEKPTIHIDSDWKRQAQEEKKRLAEQEEQRKAAQAKSQPAATPPGAAPAGPRTPAGEPGLPQATFATLVQSITTQVLFYLGELTARGAEPTVNLDMAKHNIDTLGVIEEKTKGNLTPEEKRMLDAALYETRMRFVSIASQVANFPSQ